MTQKSGESEVVLAMVERGSTESAGDDAGGELSSPSRAPWVLERDCLIIGLLADATFCIGVLALVRKANLAIGA